MTEAAQKTGAITEVLNDPQQLCPNTPSAMHMTNSAAAAKSRRDENELSSNITTTGRPLLDISAKKRDNKHLHVLFVMMLEAETTERNSVTDNG